VGTVYNLTLMLASDRSSFGWHSSPADHMSAHECLVTEYKFKIGQLVYFHPKVRPQLDVVPGPYLITRRLPATQDGECQYEIRNTLEEYNRVARESELTRA
jgi:hypothetical protein